MHGSMPMKQVAACELCTSAGGVLLWQDARLRVVHVDDAQHPGFLRVIWRDHVAEMSDLTAADRAHLFDVVIVAEAVLRELLRPDKINLASLGNMTPHLHWHVIARFRGDPQFPDPVWAASRGGAPVALGMTVAEFERSISGAMAQRAGNAGR
jgi:diadenosine tetraphosphate (Ap4A) HIT family hydrolase